ncbi:MAG: hypothetical protein LC104_15405 [Bacteroidales bacterium]|nr:hypothetical protein [Bacteroidales bacterium]
MSVTVAPPPNSPGASGPPAVPRFEYNLLRILRFVLGFAPPEQTELLIQGRMHPTPPCLSPVGVQLVRDTLAKGLVRRLAHAGGWRNAAFLRQGQPTTGRAWERVPLAERLLAFSPDPLAFLIWLTATRPGDFPWDREESPSTAADDLFFAVAYENLRQIPDLIERLNGKRVFRENALCWLLFPGDFGGTEAPRPPDFAPWFQPPRSVFLECLEPMLARHWVQTEREKSRIEDWRIMRRQGQAEAVALSAFLAAAEAAQRPDLARFLLRALAELLRVPDLSREFWTGGLREFRPTRLADRLETEQAAFAFLQQAEVLERWNRRSRTVSYFDEEYAASQLWKRDWETLNGDQSVTEAQRLLATLNPLRPT